MVNAPAFVVVHCSDSPDFSTADPRFDSIGKNDIDEWHRARGWNGIGYHWVIRQTGVLEQGRPECIVGAHCEGHNEGSLGVCLVGRGEFQPAQIEALRSLFADIHERLGIPPEKWFAHYEFNAHKTCPNVKIEVIREWLTKPKS